MIRRGLWQHRHSRWQHRHTAWQDGRARHDRTEEGLPPSLGHRGTARAVSRFNGPDREARPDALTGGCRGVAES